MCPLVFTLYLHERRHVVELVDVLEQVLDVVGDVVHVRVHRLELPLVHLHHVCGAGRGGAVGLGVGGEQAGVVSDPDGPNAGTTETKLKHPASPIN